MVAVPDGAEGLPRAVGLLLEDQEALVIILDRLSASLGGARKCVSAPAERPVASDFALLRREGELVSRRPARCYDPKCALVVELDP